MEIKAREHRNHQIIEIVGDVDLYNVSELKQAIFDVVEKDGVESLIIDMHETNYLDSSGIGALVAKYMSLSDAYRSLREALGHGGIPSKTRVELINIDSETITKKNVEKLFVEAGGILVPGGFGERGIEGKLIAIHYARAKKIPFFGICLGMQCAVIEFARNVLKYKKCKFHRDRRGNRSPCYTHYGESTLCD